MGQLRQLSPEVIHKQVFNETLLSFFHTPGLNMVSFHMFCES